MRFEYDRDKSAENKRKHGIDFEEAQALWADPSLVEIPDREKHWSAVITRREENIRLISVKRSRDEEVRIYESEDI